MCFYSQPPVTFNDFNLGVEKDFPLSTDRCMGVSWHGAWTRLALSLKSPFVPLLLHTIPLIHGVKTLITSILIQMSSNIWPLTSTLISDVPNDRPITGYECVWGCGRSACVQYAVSLWRYASSAAECSPLFCWTKVLSPIDGQFMFFFLWFRLWRVGVGGRGGCFFFKKGKL